MLMILGAGVGWGQVELNLGGPEPGKGTKIPKGVSLEAQEQETMDQILWRPEVVAQDYEEVIVGFWDLLRTTPVEDRLAVFTKMPFGSILLGELKGEEAWEDGMIRRSTGAERGVSLTMMEWLEKLKRFDPQEWQVRGSEWRHTNFLPPIPGRGARSEVEFALYVTRGEEERFQVEGTLGIAWDLEPGRDGRPKIKEIDAGSYTVVSRAGAPWWEDVMRVVPETMKAGVDAMVGPVLVRDLDRDGLPEIILGGQNLLLRNKGSFRFEEEPLFADPVRRLRSGIVEDFNGDGALDVLGVDEEGAAWLLRGREDGRLARSAERPWMQVAEGAGVMTAGDVDGDGDLDLWFAPYKPPYLGGQMPTPYYDANDGFAGSLFINDGNGMFADGTEEAGLGEKRRRRTRSASWMDLDRDGDLDLVVVSEYAGLEIYRNDGSGKFVESGKTFFDETHGFGMAHAFGDFDGDGRTDLYMAGRTSSAASRLNGLGIKRDDSVENGLMRRPMTFGNRLYQAQGERLLQTKLNQDCAEAGWSWGTTAIDLENDGDEEIYVANGHLSGASARDYSSCYWRHDSYVKAPEENAETALLLTDHFRTEGMRGLEEGLISWGGHQHNRLYLNREGEEFLEVGFLSGIGHVADCRSVVGADLDADGREDLLVVEQRREQGAGGALRQTLLVHRNVVPQTNHWLGVRLRGSGSVSVEWARVVVTGRFGTREQVVVSGDSFMAQQPAVALFGLGGHEEVERVEVFWPGGGRTVREGARVDGYLLMRPEGEGE